MPRVDVFRHVWDAWEARDLDTAVTYFDPGIVFDFSHYPAWPHDTLYVGVDRTVQALGEWMMWWKAYRQDLVGFEERGGVVLATVWHCGERDGERIDEHCGLHYYVNDDLITRWEPWEDLEASRAALTPG